jgi:hypothetical protein
MAQKKREELERQADEKGVEYDASTTDEALEAAIKEANETP